MAYPHKRERIEATVKQWLAEGKYPPGARFPSDQELARRFKVTHVTVRSALRSFVDAGLLERHIGQGTIVRAPTASHAAPGSSLGGAVGIAIPDNTHSFFGELLKGVETALFPTHRSLLLAHTWEMGEREQAAVSRWLEEGLTRLLLVPTVSNPAFYRELVARGVRLVLVDRTVEGVDVPAVTSRDAEGSYVITRALVAMGHAAIVHLGGPATASTARARQAGFERALREAGMVPRQPVVIPAGFFVEDGYRAMKTALGEGPPPDAVFAVNDPVAVGALRALSEAGLEVPRDVSVAGYADTDLARSFELTSVKQFPDRMGTEAVRILLGEGPLDGSRSLEIEPEIVLRKTTARAAR